MMSCPATPDLELAHVAEQGEAEGRPALAAGRIADEATRESGNIFHRWIPAEISARYDISKSSKIQPACQKMAIFIYYSPRLSIFPRRKPYREICLIGLPQSGKSSLFGALTGLAPEEAAAKGAEPMAVVKVPDARLDALTAIYNPKKKTFAAIELSELARVDLGRARQGGLHRAGLG